MGYSPKKTRTAWEDRFRTPSVDDLREAYPKQLGNLLDLARESLRGREGVAEEISWQGLPWRWTFLYYLNGDRSRPWAYLVPDPEKPKVSLPLSRDMVDSLPMHRFKKHVKDGVLQSRLVAGVYWATWELTSKAQLADILDLVTRELKVVNSKN